MARTVSAARLGAASAQHEKVVHDAAERAPKAEARADARAASPAGFVAKDGVEFAGTHLLVELWQAAGLADAALIRRALREAAQASGAQILFDHVHHFGADCGVTGVVGLAESHISIHTWPEHGYAAIDLFMCGDCDPYRGLAVLRRHLAPRALTVSEHRRGVRP
jgi:S-adenosylmethionine decarboxylase